MHLHAAKFTNFRRLVDTVIVFEKDFTVLVGSNNSGKTTAAHGLKLFCEADLQALKIHDFSAACCETLRRVEEAETGVVVDMPKMSIDLWLDVDPNNLHRVLGLLPRLEWDGSRVGIRIEFGPKDQAELLRRFAEAKAAATPNIQRGRDGEITYHPWPVDLTDYLREELTSEYQFAYFVLDGDKFDADFKATEADFAIPAASGAKLVASLLKVDLLNAQRHLSDTAGGARSEDLSKCLSRFYKRLRQREPDYAALGALANSESSLDAHLKAVFAPTLGRLGTVGYPGLGNPTLEIRSALNPAVLLSSPDGARVHFGLEGAGGVPTVFLPDRYNGLGFKNLIYIVVELMDLQERWWELEEDRPPLHLVFIEEPEAHMHAQLQQAFVRKVLDLVQVPEADAEYYTTQLVATTHSPHILYERGFRPIRYFRRGIGAGVHTSTVLNLSKFYETETADRDFLERYLKLTHCDLFFADAAVLVEGNVERLLLPIMIQKHAPRLGAVYLSVLEVGGAFCHKFKSLVEFLGLTCLIVTDIDSVAPSPTAVGTAGTVDADDADDATAGRGSACMTTVEGAVTSNQGLTTWLPRKTTIADLLRATEAERTQPRSAASPALVRVAYQHARRVERGTESVEIAGRTLEEDFALTNLAWTQDPLRKSLGLLMTRHETTPLSELLERLHKRIKSDKFKKTDFALSLLALGPDGWSAPPYIVDGLVWLEREMAPVPAPLAGDGA